MSGTVIALGTFFCDLSWRVSTPDVKHRHFGESANQAIYYKDNTILIRNKRTSIVLKRLAILMQRDEEKLQIILFRMHPVAYHNYLLQSPMIHPIES